jgi:hypothetical protein
MFEEKMKQTESSIKDNKEKVPEEIKEAEQMVSEIITNMIRQKSVNSGNKDGTV